MRNEKYAIWPLLLWPNAKIAAQLSYGLVNSAMGRYHVPQNVFLVFAVFDV